MRDLIEYIVLDIELLGPTRGKVCISLHPLFPPLPLSVDFTFLLPLLSLPWVIQYALANVQVARSVDFGQNDTTFLGRTHLGHILQVGDMALGYDISAANFNNDDFDKLDSRNLPDVILVKKSYAEKRKKTKTRNFKLKRLEEGTQTFGFDMKKDLGKAE